MAAQLEASQIQEIFRVKNVEKRKALLAKLLGFPEFEEDDDLKSAILLDIYHEALSFAVNEGLPWHKVNAFFEIARKTLMNIAGTIIECAIKFTTKFISFINKFSICQHRVPTASSNSDFSSRHRSLLEYIFNIVVEVSCRLHLHDIISTLQASSFCFNV